MSNLQRTMAALVASLMSVQLAFAAEPLRLQKSVRILETLQDNAANGDASARALQSKLLSQIEMDVRLADDEDLKRPQNLQALAVVLLSGADPTVIEAHIMALPMDDNMRNLLQGALAYARADRDGALHHLSDVKTDELPPSLAGRVSLVRSILDAGENPGRAIDDLTTARQLMPGTSIEEAALRRCVAFAGRVADLARLQLCSGRYMRRFSKSLYWTEFEASFAQAVGQSGFGGDGELNQLIAVTEGLGMTRQRSFLLSLARATLTRGRLDLAMTFANAAVPVCFAESTDMERAKLYRASVLLVNGNFPEASKILKTLKPERLPEKDRELLAAAARVESGVGIQPAMSDAEASQVLSTEVNPTADPAIDTALAAAREALSQSQTLLAGTKQ